MAKVLYSVTMSVDGFITGPDGDMQWMRPYLGPDPEVEQLLPRIGSVLAGRRSHDGDDPHKGEAGEGQAFGGGWSGPLFVLTHRPPDTSEPGITYATRMQSCRTSCMSASLNAFSAAFDAQ